MSYNQRPTYNHPSTYPHPPPDHSYQKDATRHPSTYELPPPSQTYTGVQGTDYYPKPADKIKGFPAHDGGYRTIPEGLNIAVDPWYTNTKRPDQRQARADQEAMVEAYWPTSPTFGPQGTTPSYNALIT